MTTVNKIEQRLTGLSDAATAAQSMKFFKTGPGQYGEGDVFLGIRVPVLRKLAKELANSSGPASRLRQGYGGKESSKSPPGEGCRNGGVGSSGISLDDTIELLQSPFHEARMLALLIMMFQYKQGSTSGRDGCPRRLRRSGTDRPTFSNNVFKYDGFDKTAIYRAYLANTDRINNWDLVDITAEHIVGKHLFERSRKPLYKLAKSKSLWERRIAIIAAFYFIRRNDFDDTLTLADLLLNDPEDLMHKAVGWMLREVGKRDQKREENFLLRRYKQMPRTMLRYAIERFDEPLRQKYLKGKR